MTLFITIKNNNKLIFNFNLKFSDYIIQNLRSKLIIEFLAKIENKNEYKSTLLTLNDSYNTVPFILGNTILLTDSEIQFAWDYLK
jgi:hypothetical protein